MPPITSRAAPIAGCVAAVLMLASLHLSSNLALRLLMKGMLAALLLCAAYAVYMSGSGEQQPAAKSGQPDAPSKGLVQDAREAKQTQEIRRAEQGKVLKSLMEEPNPAPPQQDGLR